MEINVKQTTAYKCSRFFYYLFLLSASLLLFNNTKWAEYIPSEKIFACYGAAAAYVLIVTLLYFIYNCKASKDAFNNDKKISIPIFLLFCACVLAIYILAMVLKTSDFLYPIWIIALAIAGVFDYIARQAK